MTGTCGAGAVLALGVVLRIPWHGHFIWPFAIAGLELRYLLISLTLMYGHPLRNPCLVALRRVEIFGLHNNWCANLTLLARVLIKCKKAAPSYISWGGCGSRPILVQGHGKSIWLGVVRIPSFGIGRVHRSVLGSLYPRKITLPLYTTSHLTSSNTTLHPTLYRGRIPISEAVFRSGMMCPVSVTDNPGILMSHTCVDLTFLPSGRLTVRGFVATRLFATSTPSITKMDVAPVSATAWFGAMVIALMQFCFGAMVIALRFGAMVIALMQFCFFAMVIALRFGAMVIALMQFCFGAMVIALMQFCRGLPYKGLATVVTGVGCWCGGWQFLIAKFDITTATSSWSAMETTFILSVGFRNKAETKLLHLCAISTPHCKNCPGCLGSVVLCIPLVHHAYPWLIHCCKFLRVNPT
jgi:hypothetical protein